MNIEVKEQASLESVGNGKKVFNWKRDTGTIEYPMTNDYMFRAVLQKSRITLLHLCSSALHIPVQDITDIRIDNAIELGDAITDKTFVMDINLTINNHDKVNLEMQVANEKNWNNRSLAYLCRRFDHLQAGEDYNSLAPVTHIGFLDFDLFPENPEFYANYKLMNVRTHQIFNDNFTLNVVSLRQTKLATEEDKKWQLDVWARLFKLTTWKELEKLMEEIKNTDLQSAIEDMADVLYLSNADETIREQCRVRREWLIHEQYTAKKMERLKQLEEKYADIDVKIANKESQIAEQDVKIAEQDAQIANQDAKIANQDAKIAEQDIKISERDIKISEQESKIAEQNTIITEQADALADKDAKIAELEKLLRKHNL